MPATQSSKTSRLSDATVCFFAAAVVMAAAVAWFYRAGATLYYGDAESHLDIARRLIDSRTPGWNQIGTTWLPLPHLLMIPFVRSDWLWQTGLAGAIPAAFCMALAAAFLFALVHRLFGRHPALIAAAVFLLNPNTLYLGAVPMTEPVFFAALFALLYFTIRFSDTRGWGALLGASLAALAGTLTRYEAWFLLPFVALCLWLNGSTKRWSAAILFCLVAGAGPLLWLAHNRWYYGDPLYFYRGPWSALAIQGKTPYPGHGDWLEAAHYLLAAGRLVAGWPALILGAAGLVAALARRTFWPLFLLALPPLFYVWAIHSSGVPIYVPDLPPHTWYNTRYGLTLLPLIALGIAALTRLGRTVAWIAVAIALLPMILPPDVPAITRYEAELNSRPRRERIAKAVDYLREAAGPHETFLTSFGDLTAIFRLLGVPLRDTLTGDHGVVWDAAVARPDLFLRTDWAVAEGGDEVQALINKARLQGPRYELARRIAVKNAPVVEIYRLETAGEGSLAP